MSYSYSTYSDQGPYPENQDALQVISNSDVCLACIADGVGGAARGRDAAQLVTKLFMDTLADNSAAFLHDVIEVANFELLTPSEQGLVTTFSGVLIRGLVLEGVHAGDTRVCVFRGNGIKQLTEDHTEYFRLRKEGRLTYEEGKTYPRKHILENALGSKSNPRIDTFDFTLERGDRILLTTDGVHAILSKSELLDISKKSINVDALVVGITNSIQHMKPNDNYSVIAIEVI